MKKLSVCFWVLAVLLSDIMCAVVTWNYCSMLWGIKYAGYSAPVSTAFLLAIPFVIGIAILYSFGAVLQKEVSISA